MNPSRSAAGQKNLFHTEYRCQSSDSRILPDAKKPHIKHTNCKAEMKVTIKRIGPRTGKRSVFKQFSFSANILGTDMISGIFGFTYTLTDTHLPRYPTKIIFANEHNHCLACANNVRHKDVSQEMKDKFLKLYKDGYSPYATLDVHKEDLQRKYDTNYYLVAGDRSLCPDLQLCYRLVLP